MYNNTANKFLVDSLQEILQYGMDTREVDLKVRTKYADGTPAHYLSIGSKMVEYNIEAGELPINTLRSFPMIKAINEIRWIYQKQSNKISDAEDLGVDWWKSWDIGDGTIGIRYGETVRRHLLINKLLFTFIEDPLSRRKIMSLWQESDFEEDPLGLKPCAHTTFWDLNILKDGTYAVTLTLYQRSMDLLVTSSINPFQYYILGEAVMAYLRYATGKNYKLVKLRHDIGDIHIYDRHIPAAGELLNMYHHMPELYIEARAKVSPPEIIKSWSDWTYQDFIIQRSSIPKLKNPIELAI